MELLKALLDIKWQRFGGICFFTVLVFFFKIPPWSLLKHVRKEINATEMSYFVCLFVLLPKHIGNIILIPFSLFFLSWSQRIWQKKILHTHTKKKKKSKEWGNYFLNEEVSDRARIRTVITRVPVLHPHCIFLSLFLCACTCILNNSACDSLLQRSHSCALCKSEGPLFSILCIGDESH